MSSMQSHRPMTIKTPLAGIDHDQLFVRTFRGRECLGRCFEYEVEFHTEDLAIPFEKILGGNVTVAVARTDVERDDAEPRYFNGFVSRFAQIGWEGRRMVYRATLVPWLWFLSRAVDCRVHAPRENSPMKIPDLIKNLIREQGLGEVTDRLKKSYRPWDFVVQYNESYLDFFMRLMEHEGFYGFFWHTNGRHDLVLADDPLCHGPIDPFDAPIPLFSEGQGGARVGCIRAWQPVKEFRTGRYATRDYNYEKPRAVTETVSAEKAKPGTYPNDTLEVYEYPGGFREASEGTEYARRRVEELQDEYLVCRGHTDHRGVGVGHRFELTLPNDVPAVYHDDFAGRYLVIEACYEIHNPEAESGQAAPSGPDYTCRFAAIPADTPFRLERITPRPVVRGPQTAVVVGPKGEEIHSDKQARVRIQFHWDRDGQYDEKSSIWVRVAQSVAGKGWGHQFVPRIGHEVIVSFIEGDPDRPIVTGCVYNAENPPPYDQGAKPTVSTIKTNTSKGGGGFNELRFDDEKGKEQIFLHAQKNYDQRVKNNRFEIIGHDRHLIVDNDKFEQIKNDRHEIVEGHHKEKIVGDRNLKVEGKEAIEIKGSRSLGVGGDVIEEFRENQSTVVTKDLYIKADNICIEAMTNITIKVGQSFIAIEKGGIKIGTTGSIELDAKQNITSNSMANTKIEAMGNCDMKSIGLMTIEGMAPTTVKSSAILTVQGALVKIN